MAMAVAQVVGGMGQVEGRAVLAQGRTTSTGWGAASTRTSDPSLPRSTSPPRTSVPRGRNTPRARPDESVAAKAFLAQVPVQFHGGCTLDQYGSEAVALRNEFGNLQHQALCSQNRK